MSAVGHSALRLVAFEPLTQHGFALPLYAGAPGSNALYVASASPAGDADARITSFCDHAADLVVMLEEHLHREVAIGDCWVDVFLWADGVYVGARPALWKETVAIHGEIARTAPLTMLNLVEGTGVEAGPYAWAAHEWLGRDWGPVVADRWRLDGYIRRLAISDVRRSILAAEMPLRELGNLGGIRVRLRDTMLQISLPASLTPIVPTDLPGLTRAAAAFGWGVVIIVYDDETGAAASSANGKVLLMRLRHGRGATQTQIPFSVFDTFFESDRIVRDRSGKRRSMTQSLSNGRRNTMKLQLPELATMQDPVARFERHGRSTYYELHDGTSAEGASIAAALRDGLIDGSTQRTKGGATWWRLL